MKSFYIYKGEMFSTKQNAINYIKNDFYRRHSLKEERNNIIKISIDNNIIKQKRKLEELKEEILELENNIMSRTEKLNPHINRYDIEGEFIRFLIGEEYMIDPNYFNDEETE